MQDTGSVRKLNSHEACLHNLNFKVSVGSSLCTTHSDPLNWKHHALTERNLCSSWNLCLVDFPGRLYKKAVIMVADKKTARKGAMARWWVRCNSMIYSILFVCVMLPCWCWQVQWLLLSCMPFLVLIVYLSNLTLVSPPFFFFFLNLLHCSLYRT